MHYYMHCSAERKKEIVYKFYAKCTQLKKQYIREKHRKFILDSCTIALRENFIIICNSILLYMLITMIQFS